MSIVEPKLTALAQALATLLRARGQSIATVESCTGGWVAAVLTSLSGSSQWFDRGFVTYSNQAKHEQVGVDLSMIAQYGAVSTQVAIQMACGGVAHSQAQLAISITGIAGPDGASEDKPVGTVCVAWCGFSAEPQAQRFLFDGDRHAVRQQSVEQALQGAIDLLGSQ